MLLILTPEITPRVEFTFEFIFQAILGVEVRFTTSEDEFNQSGLPKINYSQTNLASGLFLKTHPILFEKAIQDQELIEVEYQDIKLFFPTSSDSFLPFDPFALTFYVITRYEEYLSEKTDKHDRFNDSENILFRYDLHQKPIVDQMAYLIAEKISSQFPEFKIRNRKFKFLTTIDVDKAWAFKNKKTIVSFGAIVKSILHARISELKERLIVFLGFRSDPYDTYKYILETYKGLLDHIHFFFLIGDRNPYDKSISYKKPAFRQLIASISSVCEVGIHPSYASNLKVWILEKEKDRMEDIILKPVTKSRQHFLKLKFPKTYQNLLKADVSDDFTMGFASLTGFRAGTCTPFPFFDLSKNQCTELMIHSFQVMDAALKNYLHLNPAKSIQIIEELMLEVKKVDGTFISLWHNESLSETGQWHGWRKVFEQIRETGLKLEYEQS